MKAEDPRVWKSNDGDIPISDMGDRHLLNAISVLERRVPSSLLDQAPDDDDLPGLSDSTTKIQRAERKMAAVMYPQYIFLLQEAVNRGLLVDTENILEPLYARPRSEAVKNYLDITDEDFSKGYIDFKYEGGKRRAFPISDSSSKSIPAKPEPPVKRRRIRF